MNVFNIETWVEFGNGAKVRFRTPTLAEHAWARGAMKRIRNAAGDEDAIDSIMNEEIPSKLLELADNATLPGGQALPPDWREQLADLSLFAGWAGTDTVNKIFFRSRIKADEPDQPGPEG